MILPFGAQSDFDDCATAQNSYDNVYDVVLSVLVIYDPVQLHNSLLDCCDVGAFAASIVSTSVGSSSHFIIDDDSDANTKCEVSDEEDDDDASVTSWNSEILDEMGININDLISDAFVGATAAYKPTGATVKHLSKV